MGGASLARGTSLLFVFPRNILPHFSFRRLTPGIPTYDIHENADMTDRCNRIL